MADGYPNFEPEEPQPQRAYVQDERETGVINLLSLLIGFAAVVGFVVLAWYAYRSSTATETSGEIAIIQPETGVYKTIPEDPEGWRPAHQDKQVYGLLSGDTVEPNVEEIIAEPETPQPAEIADAEAQSEAWISQRARESGQPVALTEAERNKQASPVPAEQESVNVGAVPVATGTTTPAAEPEPVAEPKPEPAKAEPAPAPEPKPAAVVSGGSAKAQIGAFRSEPEARSQWQVLNKKHSSLFTGTSMDIQRADLGAKGIYYRLRATGFAGSAEAGRFCEKLKAQNIGCFPVK